MWLQQKAKGIEQSSNHRGYSHKTIELWPKGRVSEERRHRRLRREMNEIRRSWKIRPRNIDALVSGEAHSIRRRFPTQAISNDVEESRNAVKMDGNVVLTLHQKKAQQHTHALGHKQAFPTGRLMHCCQYGKCNVPGGGPRQEGTAGTIKGQSGQPAPRTQCSAADSKRKTTETWQTE